GRRSAPAPASPRSRPCSATERPTARKPGWVHSAIHPPPEHPMRLKRLGSVLLVSALALAVAGCATPAAVAPATPAPTPAAHAADDNLSAVRWVQRSHEYQATLLSLYRGAIAGLDAALADPGWDALVPAERDNPGAWRELPPAVILDVDETVLDNSIYQARL